MKLSEINEFDLIQKIKNNFSYDMSSQFQGIGDDCAIFPKNEKEVWLVSTDLLVEGVHFLKDKISAEDLGYKALAVNLSDIAAMGGKPTFLFLSLALPKDLQLSWWEDFMQGFKKLADEYGVKLMGGDTTASLSAIAINVTVIGEMPTKNIKKRSTAQIGDKIFVTGPLGDSLAGLQCVLQNEKNPALIKKHYHPVPKLKEGQWLSTLSEVHSMMDLSDGLYSDLKHITKGAVIDLENIPLSLELKEYAHRKKENAQEMAVVGGEDYELLLTVLAAKADDVQQKFQDFFKRPLFCIGEVTSDQKISYKKNNQEVIIKRQSFSHFS